MQHTRSATGTRTRSARSSWSRCVPPTFGRGRSSTSRPATRSGSKARRSSSSTAQPAGFPPGGWGLGAEQASQEQVARSESRGCERSVEIQLQVIGAALRAVAEEMGAVLVRSAFSANIKERRDCSTALFDDRGRMIVQAEHIPVHLGAMPEAVAAVGARDPRAGELYVLNDPYTGGTHLPDITLVSRTD